MATTPRDILVAARALIERPERWTQGAYRRDAEGDKCDEDHAVCWCVEGAMLHVSNRYSYEYHNAHRLLVVATGTSLTGAEHWNDWPSRTHQQVLATFDRAIELASNPTIMQDAQKRQHDYAAAHQKVMAEQL